MTYANRLPAMQEIPAEDAPLVQWLAPLSATLTTRRESYFSIDPNPTKPTNPIGLRKRPIRHAPIDGPRARRLHADGFSVDDIADVLRATTRSVVRAIAEPTRAYRSLG